MVLLVFLALFVLFTIIVLFQHFRDGAIIGSTSKQSNRNYGERRVARILSELPEGYKVINDLLISQNGRTTQIDHVVISEYRIFVIETKDYSGKIYGNNTDENWTEYIYNNSYKFWNPVLQNRGHVNVLAYLFPNIDPNLFIPIVVFSPDATLKTNTEDKVIYWTYLKDEILSYQRKWLSDIQVQSIYDILISKNNNSIEAAEKHIDNVRERIAKREQKVSQGICPRCGGKLVLRDGKYGRFYGCSNYPRCRFTHGHSKNTPRN